MGKFKSTFTALLVGLAGLTASSQADCWDPCGDCCMEIEIGADWLYWTPCINDQHYAIVTETIETVDTYTNQCLCNEWDSGVRVYGKIGNLWNDFSGALVYTYIKPGSNDSVTPDATGSVFFSNAIPVDYAIGDRATADWQMEYQTLDAVLSYSINVCQNPCLKVEAFSGLTWVDVTHDRTDVLYTDEGLETESILTVDRHNSFWAVGPTFGLNTSYKLCDCFSLFGTMQTSLVVGESENQDLITIEAGIPFAGEWNAKDKCFCFPGLHLVAGIDYELCICDFSFGLRFGWEYVQWINAPTFPFYEQDEVGVRSAPSTNDLTMQGIFVGLNASF